MRKLHRRKLALSLFAGVTASTFATWAEERPAENKAIATDLFDAGVRQMEEGGCEQAPVRDEALCRQAREAFARAYALYPAGLGALRNLAYVEKGLGRVASAARSFRELARQAPLDAKPARQLWAGFAREELEKLEPRVPRVTLLVERAPAGFELSLDDEPLPDAAWDTALDVDPGHHVLRASAPNHQAFEQTFEIAEAENIELEIALTATQAPVAPAHSASSRSPERDIHGGSSRLGPWILMGTGGAALGAGLAMGYVAIKKRQSACGDSRFCEPTELESGRSIARTATFVTSGGVAVAAGGFLWFLLSPRYTRSTAARLLPTSLRGGAGVQASGTF